MFAFSFESVGGEGSFASDGSGIERKLGGLFYKNDQLGGCERVTAEGQEAMIG
jgi:hypothetical protein